MKTFKDIWVSMNPKQKQDLADDAGTSRAYLSQIAHGHREPSLRMARRITSAARRKVKVEMFL